MYTDFRDGAYLLFEQNVANGVSTPIFNTEAVVASKPKTLGINPLQSDLLDFARWTAAFLVVIGHIRSFVFVSYQVEDKGGLCGKAFYFLTGFGHSAVMVFFVMSGFLVGGKILQRLTEGSFSWKKYAVDRGSRLYAVYVLALILGGLLDNFGYLHLNRYGLYDKSFPGRIAVVNFSFHENLTTKIFFGNLAMCQTVLVPVFGSNGPLWSLANEFWYYLTGPLVLGLGYKPSRRFLFCVIGILGGIVCFLPAEMLVYSLIWFMGAALYMLNNRAYCPIWMSLPFFLGSLTLSRFTSLSAGFVPDILIGISFCVLINSTAQNATRFAWHNISRKAADFSYSVYLCHFPFVVFAISAFYQITGFGIQERYDGRVGLLFVAILISSYIWSYLISLVTERQTTRIREWLYRLCGRDAVSQVKALL